MTIPERRRLPLFDNRALDLLGDQIDNPPAVRSFVLDFVDAWDERYLRLVTEIDDRSSVAALDAILSIKTTSTMVGAIRLASLASGVEDLIRAGEFSAATDLLTRLQSCALQTIDALIRETETTGN